LTAIEEHEQLMKEGIEALYAKLGPSKTVRFLQLTGLCRGDSVKELESKSEKLTKKQVFKLMNESKERNRELWKKLGLNQP